MRGFISSEVSSTRTLTTAPFCVFSRMFNGSYPQVYQWISCIRPQRRYDSFHSDGRGRRTGWRQGGIAGWNNRYSESGCLKTIAFTLSTLYIPQGSIKPTMVQEYIDETLDPVTWR